MSNFHSSKKGIFKTKIIPNLRSKLSCNTRLFVDVNKVIKRGVTAEDTAILFLRSNLQSAVNACATL